MTMTVARDAIPGNPWWSTPLHGITAALNNVPAWAWLALAVVLFVGLLVMRHRLEKAYQVAPPKTGDKLGGLFTAAVVVAAVLWAGILAVSGKNLTGFARDTLHFTGGWEYTILAGLDGIAVAFAVVMFAAVQAGRPADRAYRIVWSATLMSAVIGAWHGYDGNTGSLAAAALLGYFALAAMAVLHELLDLFRSTTTKRAPRIRPPFGLRWVTYFPNTLCAALAWENHPPRPLPANATEEQIVWYGSVRHAVAHLELVRRAKRVARYRLDVPAAALPAAGWARLFPWLRARQLDAALAAAHAETTGLRTQLDEATALFETASTDLDRVTAELRQAEAGRRDADERAAAATAETERVRREAAAAVEAARLDAARRVAAAEQTAALRGEQVDRVGAHLATAREATGRLRQQLADVTAEAARHAAEAEDARRRADAADAAHRAAVAAAAHVSREQVAHGGGEQVAHDRPALRDRRTPKGARGSGAADRSPSSPPWSARQERAFELRDGDPKTWTWDRLADEVGAGASSVRRWFNDRQKHQAKAPAVPSTPIDNPKQPAMSGTNGTALHRD